MIVVSVNAHPQAQGGNEKERKKLVSLEIDGTLENSWMGPIAGWNEFELLKV